MKPRKPWPFSETLAPKVCWYRATHQMQFPSVVAESVVAREHPAGRCPDFLWRFQFALGHSLLERFEFLLHFLHRLSRSPRSYSRRSSLWTTKTRTPDLPEATSCTKVFGTCDFSRAEIPAGHSNQGPLPLWI